MKTTISTADLHASVISVPPLCRDANLKSDAAENAKLIKHIESGGVSTLLYGGNANFYNIALGEYEAVLDQLESAAAADTLIVPSFANFVLVKVGSGKAVFNALMKRGIIVRDMTSYALPEWIRVSIGTPEQNERFLAELKRLPDLARREHAAV